MAAQPKKNYMDKTELLTEILQSKKNDKLTKRAEELLIILAKETIKKKPYTNYEDRKDCMQEGLLTLFQRWRNFDESISTNAFAYYTEIFKRAIAKGFNDIYDKNIKTVSISSANNGDGFFSPSSSKE